eukprot:scaffold41651_cov68-Phaeocystis_antarctica.AAC.2
MLARFRMWLSPTRQSGRRSAGVLKDRVSLGAMAGSVQRSSRNLLAISNRYGCGIGAKCEKSARASQSCVGSFHDHKQRWQRARASRGWAPAVQKDMLRTRTASGVWWMLHRFSKPSSPCPHGSSVRKSACSVYVPGVHVRNGAIHCERAAAARSNITVCGCGPPTRSSTTRSVALL